MTANPEPAPATGCKWPAAESSYDRSRREWNLLIRRPVYVNLRLGLTQNALWVGRGYDNGGGFGEPKKVFNVIRNAGTR